jgi:hypothetical protein
MGVTVAPEGDGDHAAKCVAVGSKIDQTMRS